MKGAMLTGLSKKLLLLTVALVLTNAGRLAASETLWPTSRVDSLTPLFGPTPTGVLNTAIGFQIRIGGWLPQTRSHAKIDDPGESRVNFSNLSAKPEDVIPALDLGVTLLSTHKIRLGYWDSTQEGKTTLGAALTYDGTTFPGSTNIKSTVELSVIKVGYEYMLLDGEFLKLGAGLGVDIISTKGQIQATGAALSGKQDDQLFVPFISGEASMVFGGFSLFANVDLMHYGPVYMFDGRAGASFGFDIPPQAGVLTLGLGVDWRIWDVAVDNSSYEAEWAQQGLEFFAFARF